MPDRYLDLPVYDAIRSVGDDYRTRNPEEEVLVLRWFDEEYGRLVGDEIIRNRLETPWPNARVVTTLDSRSPQLIEQRLYAAIRRDRLCLVDWTGSRPNTFFELGVRLAASEHDPVCVLCDEQPPGWNEKRIWPAANDPWLLPLASLLGLTRFSATNTSPLRDRIASYDKPVAGATLSRGRTYAVVAGALDVSREPGGEPTENWLMRNAESLTGAGIEDGSVPVLYPEALKEQVRRASVERALAAWLYVDRRYRLSERMRGKDLATDDHHLETLKSVGARLSAAAHNADLPDLATMVDEVRQKLREISRYQRGDKA